jgi:hypothetical protein
MQSQPHLKPIFSEFHKATDLEIRELEAVMRGSLPVQVVRFLRSCGGAGFAGQASVMAADGTSCGVFTIFRACGPSGSVMNDLAAHPDFAARSLLPVADDLSNNRYVVEMVTGKVYFIEYAHGQSCHHEVAESFDDFMSSIRVIPW